ncbi:MAG: glycosyltransferase, partial [Chloroflexi bacterium]|nr:glycosyltransferase [Chloroflexota bacterium]
MLEWLYLICLCLLAVYGANSAVLTLIYWFKPRQPAPGEPLASLSLRPTLGEGSGVREPAAWPTVTVQLPVYNERYVVERLLDAVGALDYPADRLQIQVLDDSTDETCAIIDRVTARLRARGKEVAVIRRARKTGFKGGALAAGTAEARGEFIAIFDADFLPPPGFLKQTIPHLSGARVGCVQTRWGHVNADYSLLTRLQAAGIDGHFMVEQEARNRMGWFIGFNGSAGVWRKACIESAGGWQTDTLTEDLDLSYRAQLAGWTFKFLTDVVAPAEVPAQMDAYRRQQFRWAKGSVQTARKLLPALWRAPLAPAVKLQGTLHLTGYLMHLLMVVAFVLTVPVSLVQSPVLALLPTLALTMVGPFGLYGTAVWRRSRSVLNLLGTLAMLVVLGTGMSINNARAAVEALLGINSAFRRTPKFDLRSRADQWRASRYS